VDYESLIQTLGLPVAMLVVALVSSRMRWWVWMDELKGCEARMATLKADYEARLEAQRLAHAQREAEMAAATARWEKLFFEMLGPIAGAVEVVAARTGNGGKPP
jgi:hypothetical protein